MWQFVGQIEPFCGREWSEAEREPAGEILSAFVARRICKTEEF
jgi:hypothetical protein